MLKQIVNYSALGDMIRNVKRNMPYVDLLGEGVVINGTYRSDKNVRVVGSIEGDLYVQGRVTIEETGVVNGNVFADKIDISGVVRGDLQSKSKIMIRRSAVISGGLRTKALEIEQHAIVEGGICMSDNGNPSDGGRTADDIISAEEGNPLKSSETTSVRKVRKSKKRAS